MTPMMTGVFEVAAIGAAVVAAIFVRNQFRIQRRVHALDRRLAQMQKEIDVLQVQESRRAMMALKANTKVEAPGIEPDEGDTVDLNGGDVVRLVGGPAR
jgi:hypothetical protein